MTWWPGGDPETYGGLLRDIDEGYSKRIAIVVPPGAVWPLPAYELALMTAGQARAMGHDDVTITVVTPERRALSLFGDEASEAVTEELADAGVELKTGVVGLRDKGGAHARARWRAARRPARLLRPAARRARRSRACPPTRRASSSPATTRASRAASAPGRRATPSSPPLKFGGLATHQARRAAAAIARARRRRRRPDPGEPVHPRPADRPAARMRSLSGRGDAEGAPLWWPQGKIAGEYLPRWLTEHGVDAARRRGARRGDHRAPAAQRAARRTSSSTCTASRASSAAPTRRSPRWAGTCARRASAERRLSWPPRSAARRASRRRPRDARRDRPRRCARSRGRPSARPRGRARRRRAPRAATTAAISPAVTGAPRYAAWSTSMSVTSPQTKCPSPARPSTATQWMRRSAIVPATGSSPLSGRHVTTPGCMTAATVVAARSVALTSGRAGPGRSDPRDPGVAAGQHGHDVEAREDAGRPLAARVGDEEMRDVALRHQGDGALQPLVGGDAQHRLARDLRRGPLESAARAQRGSRRGR